MLLVTAATELNVVGNSAIPEEFQQVVSGADEFPFRLRTGESAEVRATVVLVSRHIGSLIFGVNLVAVVVLIYLIRSSGRKRGHTRQGSEAPEVT